MVASIFKNYIVKYFSALAAKLTAKVNDKEEEIAPLHKQYLRPEFSADMKFSSLSSNTSIVAADVVALDSELTPKKRGKISSAEGEVPKLGMIKQMNESQLQALKNLKARGNKEAELVKKVFADAVHGVKGIYERLDIMFLQALSTGVTLIDDTNNTGAAIRVDFGVPDSNQFGVGQPWTEADALPIDDIENVTANARDNGTVPTHVWMDKATYNAFKMNEQVKSAFAGFNRVAKELVFRINRSDLDAFLAEEYSLSLIVVDKVVQIEKGGKKQGLSPWEKGNVAFTVGTDLGTITWSELAEVDSPVKDVEYAVVDNFILTSLFRTNNPLKENTSVQALALPVLDNVDSIYIMDTKEATAAEDTQTEGDSNYSYKSVAYTKQSVVDGINAAREAGEGEGVAEAKIENQDATLARKIDALSEAGVTIFEDKIVAA